MSQVAMQLEELRDVVGEIDALAALALESFDHADWSGADQLIVERMAYVLGMIARSAATAASKFDGLEATVADRRPAAAGERRDGPAPGKETAASARDAERIKRDAEIVRRLRERCADAFDSPTSHPFFRESYLAGEDPDAALLRLFKSNKQVLGRSDEEIIAAMAHRR
jgi:hypothetical protein